MVGELYTQLVSDVATEVKAQFGEEGDVQITDAHILRWINRGQREIAVRTRFLKAQADINLVAGTATYDLEDERLLQIDSVFVSGYPIQIISVEDADRNVRYLDPEGTSSAARPEVVWLDNGVLNLHPKPSQSVTSGLRVKYLQYPAAVTATGDTLTVPDRFFNQLLKFCLAQAQYLDADHEQSSDDMREFEEGLARQSHLQNVPPAAEYPQVGYDPEDFAFSSGDGYFG